MHSVAVLTSLVKSLLNLNFVCMTRCTERERTSHPLARFLCEKRGKLLQARTCSAGQEAGGKLLERTCLVLRANTMPVKLFIIKREKFSKVINLPISNTDKQGGLCVPAVSPPCKNRVSNRYSPIESD